MEKCDIFVDFYRLFEKEVHIMLNKKAQIFQKYLNEKKITCFNMQEIEGDTLNTVVFRSIIDVEGQQLPTLVILDSSIYAMIRVRVANAALQEENKTALVEAINKINSQYKIFKYYFADDGALILDSYVLSRQEELDCDMIYTVLDIIVKHLTAEYKNIMKLIWA